MIEPVFTGPDWYARCGERHADDEKEGRLVSMHVFGRAPPGSPYPEPPLG